ncbi:hypothetical protein V6N13_103701 [Hibiscus sabdariffa]
MICSVVRTTGVVNRSGLRFATGCVLNSTTNTRSAAAGTALLHRLEDLRVRTSALSRHAKILRHALLHQNLNALGPSPCYHRCNDIQRVIKATWSKSKPDSRVGELPPGLEYFGSLTPHIRQYICH